VRILKDFKSSVLELQILKGLEVNFAEVRILKNLEKFFRETRGWVFAARQVESVEQNTPDDSTIRLLCQQYYLIRIIGQVKQFEAVLAGDAAVKAVRESAA